MRLEQLHYFEMLAQEGSFTKAAAKLHIAQPSLTSSIKSMEKELDTTLVIRDAHGIAITKDGQKVLRFSQAVLNMHKNLLDELKSELSPEQESITVFASNFFNNIILENFLSNHISDLQFQVRSVEHDFIPSLESYFINNCNFAIISCLTAEDESKCSPGMLVSYEKFFNNDFIYIPIFKDIFGLCMAHTSPLAFVDDKNLAPSYIDTMQHPMTVFPHRNIKLPGNVLFSSFSIKHHIQALTQNNAICSLPYFAYQYYFSQEESLTFRAYSNGMTLNYYLIYPVEHTLTAAEQIFIDELQTYLKQMKFK